MFRYRRPFSRDFIFVVGILAGWFLWWYFYLAPRDLLPTSFVRSEQAYFTWAFLAGFFTLSILYWIDFFRPFKGNKFIPDLFAMLMVVPIAGALAKPVAGMIFSVEFLRTREILHGCWLPALCIVLLESVLTWAKGKSSVKSTVYLALTAGETERFVESIHKLGWAKYYRILSQSEFDGALATGGHVDYIVISRVATKNFLLHQNILQAQMLGVAILDFRTVISQIRGHITVHDTDLWTFLAGSVRQNWIRATYRMLKFYLEPVIAAIMLVALSLPFLFVALLIKITSPGPVFFRQRRTGFQGFDFDLVKFRSMRMDAEASGARWATKTDARVTGFGKFLRKSRIDELPQLWNVMKGEMSFIGPRPERPEFYELIGRQVPLFRLRLLVRPGITGWAQLLGGYAASIEESERKLEYDLYYMQYLSPRIDLIIVGRTLLTLVRGNSGQ